MKELRVSLLPLYGTLVHPRVTPSGICRYPFLRLGEEKKCQVTLLVKGNNTMKGATPF